jgi:hypothetical protein
VLIPWLDVPGITETAPTLNEVAPAATAATASKQRRTALDTGVRPVAVMIGEMSVI